MLVVLSFAQFGAEGGGQFLYLHSATPAQGGQISRTGEFARRLANQLEAQAEARSELVGADLVASNLLLARTDDGLRV
jgi:hypothetical protein